MKILIAVPTFHRERALHRLVGDLMAQTTKVPHACTIAIIDNSEGATAMDIVATMQTSYSTTQVTVTYTHEPRRGIAFARNVAADMAGAFDCLVFIDDDELPSDNWLESIITAFTNANVPIVAGPVVPTFGHDVPRWMSEGAFHDRQRHPSGSMVNTCGAGNVAISPNVFEKVRFNEHLGSYGGEDTEFFMTLSQMHDTKIYWCDEAVVYEEQPPHRTTVSYICKRSRGNGISVGRLSNLFATTRFHRTEYLARGTFRVVHGICTIGVGAVRRRKFVFVTGLRTVTYGIGVLQGVLRFRQPMHS